MNLYYLSTMNRLIELLKILYDINGKEQIDYSHVNIESIQYVNLPSKKRTMLVYHIIDNSF